MNLDPLHPHVNDFRPHWAIATCNGELIVGAQLPTRDGRRTGNAHIVHIGTAPWDANLELYTVLTDAGTVLKLLASEVVELYYQPQWVSDVREVMRKFKDRDQPPENLPPTPHPSSL